MPSIPQMGYVWDAGESAVQLAFSGQRTPLQALQNATQQVIDLSK
jgi:maltose-binding protein MalE